jgi:hypothetical protein
VNGDWLRGEPLRSWLAARPHVPLIGPLLSAPWLAWLFTYGSLLLDLLLAPALFWRRTRAPAVCFAIGFHLLNWQLFGLSVFPWLMIAATLLFLAPDQPQQESRDRRLVPRERVALGLLAVYVAVQLLVPLRHYLYPGNVSWTEEGHQFAWHMMLREKHGAVRLRAVDPDTGQSRDLELWRYLTPLQRRKMSIRPQLIQQLAHHVAADRLAVYALATATLNGHPRQWLIDPRIDLAAERRSLWPASWIVPLGTTVPGHPLPPEKPRRRRSAASD